MPERLGLFHEQLEYVDPYEFSFATFKDEFQDNTGLFVEQAIYPYQT